MGAVSTTATIVGKSASYEVLLVYVCNYVMHSINVRIVFCMVTNTRIHIYASMHTFCVFLVYCVVACFHV